MHRTVATIPLETTVRSAWAVFTVTTQLMAMRCLAPAVPARCKWLQTSQCPYFIIWTTNLPSPVILEPTFLLLICLCQFLPGFFVFNPPKIVDFSAGYPRYLYHSQSKGCLSVWSCYQFCHSLCGETQAYAVSVYAWLCWIQVWKVQLWNIHLFYWQLIINR